MIAGPSIALMILAQAPAQSSPPAAAAAATPAPAAQPAPADQCDPSKSDGRTIVICAQRDQSYRLNPDLIEAKRELRNPGPPKRPGTAPAQPCGIVGPQPCQYGGISPIGVVLTAAEMAKRVAEGKEIGSMFETDPHPSEYQLYLMAKKRREQREAEEAAQARAKARAAAAAQASSAPLAPVSN